jgi:hypothetical protein
MPSEDAALPAFLLTNNPSRWEFFVDDLAEWIESTANGHLVEGRWSTGNTTKKIAPGDRAFLIRQGVKRRGIFASGHFITDVFQAAHWDGTDRAANYADVHWDTVLDPDDALPIEILFSELPEGEWEPNASGTQIKPEVVDRLEKLWTKHIAAVRGVAAPRQLPPPSGKLSAEGQGRRLDAKLRRQLEDLAQRRLTARYEADGWDVEDLRVGNPFDARATKDDEVLYLEAKGTVTDGERVIVTRGEVKWARDHPGECVIGILSGITLKADGTVDEDSGILRLYEWSPADDDLVPIEYDFYPPAEADLDAA